MTFHHTALRICAALCLAAQVVMGAHFLLVPHTRCAEHGELVHDDAHGHRISRPVEASPTDATVAIDVVVGDHEGDHDHCLATHDRRKGLSVAPSVVSVPLGCEPIAVSWMERERVPSLGRYRLAPKTSPPAA